MRNQVLPLLALAILATIGWHRVVQPASIAPRPWQAVTLAGAIATASTDGIRPAAETFSQDGEPYPPDDDEDLCGGYLTCTECKSQVCRAHLKWECTDNPPDPRELEPWGDASTQNAYWWTGTTCKWTCPVCGETNTEQVANEIEDLVPGDPGIDPELPDLDHGILASSTAVFAAWDEPEALVYESDLLPATEGAFEYVPQCHPWGDDPPVYDGPWIGPSTESPFESEQRMREQERRDREFREFIEPGYEGPDDFETDFPSGIPEMGEVSMADPPDVSPEIGSDDGWSDGSDDGWSDGSDDGWSDGSDDGWDDGSDDGWSDGTDDGWDGGSDGGSSDGDSDDGDDGGSDDGSDGGSDDGSDGDSDVGFA